MKSHNGSLPTETKTGPTTSSLSPRKTPRREVSAVHYPVNWMSPKSAEDTNVPVILDVICLAGESRGGHWVVVEGGEEMKIVDEASIGTRIGSVTCVWGK